MIAFLDFETTGLKPSEGAEPIEVAVVVTDDAFCEIGAFESIIQPTRPAAEWDAVSEKMHAGNGLLNDLSAYPPSRAHVGQLLGGFLKQYAVGALHLAGNSVHFDRAFLGHYWPHLEALFHHRHVDVSALRMVGERVTTALQFAGDKPHRAMADVRRSIAEMHHWVAAIRGSQGLVGHEQAV